MKQVVKLVFNEQIFDRTLTPRQLFDYCMALKGEVFKRSPQRVVYRFVHDQQRYFIKIHSGVGWREIVKNWLQLKWPVVDAAHEWRALMRLQRLGIPTLEPVGFGSKGINPARRQSFIITRELSGTVSLEETTNHWKYQSPPVALKQALMAALADIVRKMHEGGMNHRDCYLCHFRLKVENGIHLVRPDHLILHVIDLHRAQCRKQVPERWLIKDIAGLYFSSMSIGLTERDRFRFIKYYTQHSLRHELTTHQYFWRQVERTAKALYKKHQRRQHG